MTPSSYGFLRRALLAASCAAALVLLAAWIIGYRTPLRIGRAETPLLTAFRGRMVITAPERALGITQAFRIIRQPGWSLHATPAGANALALPSRVPPVGPLRSPPKSRYEHDALLRPNDGLTQLLDRIEADKMVRFGPFRLRRIIVIEPGSPITARQHAVLRLPFWTAFVVLTVAPVLIVTPGAIRRYHRHRKGLCLSCGYDLTGNVSGVCPECGQAVTSGPRSTLSRS
ncbi:MAG: hypothetical protein JSU68_11025 [Phycisphaerales bacterium]|nr:MAG: hypothetical protein JSU68_11025 [Phycisphaerales bacterium]